MFDLASLLLLDPFGMVASEKTVMMTAYLKQLTRKHYEKCPAYRKMLEGVSIQPEKLEHYMDIPFLPVSLFKELTLKSVPDNEVFKILMSSGTTGQEVSKIYLSKENAANQQKVLTKIVSSFTGAARMPMLIIDSPNVINNRALFSARGAGVLGFSIFGTDRTYALDNNMEMDIAGIEAFLEKHSKKRIFLFGFTFMIWQHFYKELLKLDRKFDLSNGILVHGGGWKKLSSEAISPEEFKRHLADVCGLSDIHDYYGMVEQTGCIYMECEFGHLHTSIFSDILIRRALDFSLCEIGEKGIIQVVSVLPESYPGHSLLTEDEGVLVGRDDCQCGRKGCYFKILGRLKNAEIRGCSDTYAANFK